MSIKNSTVDSDLKNEETVKFEAQTNCKGKGWPSFLYVLALTSVIKRRIFSHFPDCVDYNCHLLHYTVQEWKSVV